MQEVSGHKWKELKDSQEKIEKLSFDCINQHDIVTNQIYELTACINEIMVKLDETVYTVEDVMQGESTNSHASEGKGMPLKMLEQQLNEQMELLVTLSQHFNNMMEQRGVEGEVVHEIEGMVEKQKQIIDLLLEHE